MLIKLIEYYNIINAFFLLKIFIGIKKICSDYILLVNIIHRKLIISLLIILLTNIIHQI